MSPAARWLQRLQRDWWLDRPSALVQLLRPLAGLYALVVALRRQAYRNGWFRSQAAPVPVLVVGNLIVGGAGKTPTVLALLDELRSAGRTPGVISRGHGRHGSGAQPVHPDSDAAQVGDEPLLIRRRSGVPVWVGARRIDAARALCAAHPQVDVLVADDGLQHLALRRDAQLIVFDERGVGNGLLLPAGPLREPMTDTPPPRSVVLYNAAAPSTRWPGALATRTLAGAVPLAGWWRGEPASHDALRQLRGAQVWAAAGIASPQRFFDMLRAEGLSVRGVALTDHHRFDVLPWPADGATVLVTEKDAVKLRPAAAGTTVVWVLRLDLTLPPGLVASLLSHLPKPP